jgi:hypothetical protein
VSDVVEAFHHPQMFHESAQDEEGMYLQQTHHHQVLDEVVDISLQ